MTKFMKMPAASMAAMLLTAVAASFAPSVANATELEPFDYMTLPAGTDVLVLYGFYGDHDSLKPQGGPELKDGTNLETEIGIVKVGHYFDIGETRAFVEAFQVVGSLNNARIGGAPIKSASGFGDTTVAGFVWPISDPESGTYLGTGVYVTLPTGRYRKTDALNVGGNRMVYNPQVALSKRIAKGLTLELAADLIFYGDNKDAGVAGAQRLKQDTTFQGQAFLNYSLTPSTMVALGYQAMRGGDQKLDGVGNGNSTRFDEARLIASQMVTPKIQVMAEANHQFNVEGGFKQDFGFMLRTLFIF